MAKKKSAGARIKGEGRSLVWATFTAAEKQKISAAAGIAGIPMSQLVRESAIRAAEKIISEFRTGP